MKRLTKRPGRLLAMVGAGGLAFLAVTGGRCGLTGLFVERPAPEGPAPAEALTGTWAVEELRVARGDCDGPTTSSERGWSHLKIVPTETSETEQPARQALQVRACNSAECTAPARRWTLTQGDDGRWTSGRGRGRLVTDPEDEDGSPVPVWSRVCRLEYRILRLEPRKTGELELTRQLDATTLPLEGDVACNAATAAASRSMLDCRRLETLRSTLDAR